MLKILKQAIKTGIVTNDFPKIVANPPDGFRGFPSINFQMCTACGKCSVACPTDAISIKGNSGNGLSDTERNLTLNYGDCIFCGECESACPEVIQLSKIFLLATIDKAKLLTTAYYKVNRDGMFSYESVIPVTLMHNQSVEEIGTKLKKTISDLLGRSLHIREVDAGSCNGCEIEITALNNSIYDIERFGIRFVASPRHADMLLVTGPVTRNMEIPLKQTYDATPSPKLVVAVGACGIGGGIFGESYASCGGIDNVIPVNVYIPGCPPRPEALLQGIFLAIRG